MSPISFPTFSHQINRFHSMALITSSLNAKLKPCPSYFGKRQLSILCFNQKRYTSNFNIPKPSLSIDQNSILKLKGLINIHDENRRQTTTMLLASVGSVIPEEDTRSHRKPLDEVIVKWAMNVFTGRIMNSGATTMTFIVMIHVLALFAPFTFSWGAFWVVVFRYVVHGMLGITLSYHRNLSHKSFKMPKWLEYFCAYCGVLAIQGNPIDWVSIHRYHHQHTDTEKDPHSPLKGFWYSHMGWLFDSRTITERCGEESNVEDLEKQPFYRFIRSTYILHPIAAGVILYALGGFPYIVWGVGVAGTWGYHVTWLVNSASHIWGSQTWSTGDLSRNNWWVSLVSFGEGWHNNHHAFEYSARHGLEWWQIDVTWYTIRLFQAIGLAKDVKTPIDAHKKRMELKGRAKVG